MDDRTKAALEGSIAKWAAIVAGTGEDRSSSNCPLCKCFIEENGPDDVPEENQVNCYGCPVSERTVLSGCGETPYEDWASHYFSAHGIRVSGDLPGVKIFPGCSECARIAQDELDFLISLREAE